MQGGDCFLSRGVFLEPLKKRLANTLLIPENMEIRPVV